MASIVSGLVVRIDDLDWWFRFGFDALWFLKGSTISQNPSWCFGASDVWGHLSHLVSRGTEILHPN